MKSLTDAKSSHLKHNMNTILKQKVRSDKLVDQSMGQVLVEYQAEANSRALDVLMKQVHENLTFKICQTFEVARAMKPRIV